MIKDKNCKRCDGSGKINMHSPPAGRMAYCPRPCPDCQEFKQFSISPSNMYTLVLTDKLEAMQGVTKSYKKLLDWLEGEEYWYLDENTRGDGIRDAVKDGRFILRKLEGK